MIRTKNLLKTYQTEEVETTAINNLNIEINKGEFVSIMGPSGCGKSTLLNVLGLIDSPTGGEFWFLDQEVSTFNERQRSDLRKFNIGFIFQSFNLIEELTTFENVELPLLYTNVPPRERKERVEKALEQMNMQHRINHFPRQLSGGQQQRVAFARAIINEPSIIMADEPTGNLDTTNGNDVMDTLLELNQNGTTIAMVTHSEACARYGNRVIRLLDGQLVEEEVIHS